MNQFCNLVVQSSKSTLIAGRSIVSTAAGVTSSSGANVKLIPESVASSLSIATRGLKSSAGYNISSYLHEPAIGHASDSSLLRVKKKDCPTYDIRLFCSSSYSCANSGNRINTPEFPGSSTTCELHTGVLPVLRSAVAIQKAISTDSEKMEERKLMSKEEREEFMSFFSQLVRDLVEIPEYRDMPDVNKWLQRMLQYNVPHGKRNRGLATTLAYRYLATELTEENIRLSYVLGWCVEILQAYFLVADDIMDESETRRGRPCWYRLDNLGPSAFNDALLLESSIYMLLKKYFGDKPYYVDLLEIMHDVNHKTVYGQSLDTRTGIERNMESYTMDRYSAIVKYKTSFYSFYLPVRLALAMAGINNSDVLQQVKTVTLEMGHFFQVQDDFLDCFGDIEITGKIGTDIQDCKCSWMFVVAYQKCTPEQKKLLLENYGQNDPIKIERVKQLYTELNLPEVYKLYEEQTYNLICTHIQQMSAALPKGLFMEMVNKIYRRNG